MRNLSNKQKLIQLLKEGLDAEEKAIPIYSRHLESAAFWVGLPPEKVRKLKSALQLFARESAQHKIVVDKMLVKLCRE